MPVFINEVTTDVSTPVVSTNESQASETRIPVSQPEFEFLKTLTLIEERRERLQFD